MNAKQALRNLQSYFGEYQTISRFVPTRCTIGVEIEVKWRDYFPELWQIVKEKGGFPELTPEETRDITEKCNVLESNLLPMLEDITKCGVPKGNDRYWEFAFAPVHNVLLVVDMIKLLIRHKAIPTGSHSLHITIADLDPTRHVYHMLMMLELLYIDKQRIQMGFNKNNHKMSATWSRKGSAGLFVKDENDLVGGAKKAVELRTLEIDTETVNIESLFTSAALFSNAVFEIQNGFTNTILALAFLTLVDKMTAALNSVGLEDKNWKKPNIDPNSWIGFIDNYETLQVVAKDAYRVFMCQIDPYDIYAQ